MDDVAVHLTIGDHLEAIRIRKWVIPRPGGQAAASPATGHAAAEFLVRFPGTGGAEHDFHGIISVR
jgi:hypothetical protein